MNTKPNNFVAVHIVGSGSVNLNLPGDPAICNSLHRGVAVIVELDGIVNNGLIKHLSTKPDGEASARFIRLATESDQTKIAANETDARSAITKLTTAIRDQNIPFKPIDASYSFNRDRLSVLFASEQDLDPQRLDTLAQGVLSDKVEFHQIGVRDECAFLGGIGLCGRPLCCCDWQKYFNHINIRMAKAQDMTLTPAALNGACERLKCCLRFEYDQYVEASREFPRYGTFVEIDGIRGEVVGRDVMRGQVTLRTNNNTKVRLSAEPLLEKLRKP